jgi:hypothetical protein
MDKIIEKTVCPHCNINNYIYEARNLGYYCFNCCKDFFQTINVYNPLKTF